MPKTFRVPFYDHAVQYRSIKPEIEAAISRVLESGKYRNGPEVSAFEEELAAECGTEHVVTAGSCYGAMFKALLALGIVPGDEIITVANASAACVAAIHHTGATLKWVDVYEQDCNMDVSQIDRSINSRTKGILVVHMYGHPADMDSIMTIAEQNSLFVLEDAALALGALYKGRKVGTIGDIGCFSHAPTKILGNYGDGGSAITDNDALAQKMRDLSICALESQNIKLEGKNLRHGYHYRSEGYHDRMGDISCAILRTKLKHVANWITRRREIASQYTNLLDGLGALLPSEGDGAQHVYRNYAIQIDNRDQIRFKLAERGIETGIQYVPPLHLQGIYAHLGYGPGSLPVTEAIAKRLLTLPLYPELTDRQVMQVARALEGCV